MVTPMALAAASLDVHPHVIDDLYSHGVSSAGFWQGQRERAPRFYSYAAREPAGFPRRIGALARATSTRR
jgi:hypothetical protein